MNSLKTEESCVENKQSITASCSSISEGSSGFSTLSPACSPANSSPNHRRTSGPIRRAKGGWTPNEDETLKHAVELHKARNWKKIAESVPGRTEVQCLHRWQKVLNPELIKGPWTPEEDNIIIELVAKYGPTKWSIIAGSLPGRIGKQCRERWHNHLNPEIRKDAWTSEEEMELMKAHLQYGNKWAEIAKVLPGRSDNSIKNHWNSSLRKRSEVYVKTGKFPPVQKPVFRTVAKTATNFRNVAQPMTNFRNVAQPMTNFRNVTKATSNTGDRQLFHCYDKELNISGKTVLENCSTVPFSLPSETPEAESQKDGVSTLSSQVLELNATLDVAARLSDNSDARDCQARASEINLVQNRSESAANLDSCRLNGEVHRNEEPLETIHYSVPDNFGSLCYKPPQLEDLGAATFSSLFFGDRSMQPTSDHAIISSPSPICRSTPSPVNILKSCQPSVESILKSAARSFPNTPSIIKRRKELHIPLPPETMHTNETRIQESCTPKEGSTSKISKLFSSPLNISGGSLDYGKNLNFSPVYQLRSKRKATFKSLEKQLDFTMEEANLESNTKISSLAVNKSSSSPTNMQFLSI
ncbi:hypothetical protein M5K25_011737 [Dendrobium thyrsiflorum]|uniref:Uncharacterized protein n=1 Tax=Dendrobium thyrsiflorum TaxID=117978 RepID=A0ABD0V4U7_DENTH